LPAPPAGSAPNAPPRSARGSAARPAPRQSPGCPRPRAACSSQRTYAFGLLSARARRPRRRAPIAPGCYPWVLQGVCRGQAGPLPCALPRVLRRQARRVALGRLEVARQVAVLLALVGVEGRGHAQRTIELLPHLQLG